MKPSGVFNISLGIAWLIVTIYEVILERHTHKQAFVHNWKFSSSHAAGAYVPFVISKSMIFGWIRMKGIKTSFIPLGIFLEKWINIKNFE